MDKISLEDGLRDLPLGGMRYFTRLESTNTEAAHWANAGAPDLALVVADEQTAGRGRSGRSWYTPPGGALAFSLVLKNDNVPKVELSPDGAPKPPVYNFGIDLTHTPAPHSDPDWPARLTALGAVAVATALESLYGLQAQVKWPNDVLLNRRKVSGVLTEAHWQRDRLQALILGIGVNTSNAAVPGDDQVIFPATSVETELGRSVDRIKLLQAILGAIVSWRSRIATPEFLQAWERRLAFKGEKIRIYSGADATAAADVEGELLGLDERGCLRLRDASGIGHAVCNGELRLRPAE